MKIQVNGTEQVIEDAISLLDLIRENKVEQPDMVSVQINGEFIVREKFNATIISEDDEIDFLYFMGGGSQ